MYEQKEQGRGEDEAGVKKKSAREWNEKRGRKGLKLEEGEEDGLKKMKGGR